MEKKLVEFELETVAHNKRVFANGIVLENLHSRCNIIKQIKTRKRTVSLKINNGIVNKKNNSNGRAQYITFTCSATHLSSSLEKLGEIYGLQKERLKQEMNLTEINEDTWQDHRNGWLPYLRMDVLSPASIYGRYLTNMAQITNFVKIDCFFLPSLGWKFCNSTRIQKIELIYSNTDKFTRPFVRQSTKSGKVGAFFQY